VDGAVEFVLAARLLLAKADGTALFPGDTSPNPGSPSEVGKAPDRKTICPSELMAPGSMSGALAGSEAEVSLCAVASGLSAPVCVEPRSEAGDAPPALSLAVGGPCDWSERFAVDLPKGRD
jgi:hypothetical protein